MDKNDIQELLIRAACAAGIELDLNTPCNGGFRAKQNGRWTSRWAPNLDDGDALRLAVKLNLNISGCRAVYAETGGDLYTDPYAATRLSILHAAAAQHEHR
jgi:hypothetical protein